MAFISTENFESLGGNNTDVHGTSGGSNWTTAWARFGDDWLCTTGSPISGTKSAISQTSGCGMERSFTGVTDGVIRFKVRRSSSSSGTFVFEGASGTTVKFTVTFNASGNIVAGGSTLQAYSANTTYIVDVEFDCGPDQFRVRIDNGSWSSWFNFASTSTTIDKVRFSNTAGTATNIVDDIETVSVASGPTNLKSLDGNLKANIKSVDGNLIANVKSLDGNA